MKFAYTYYKIEKKNWNCNLRDRLKNLCILTLCFINIKLLHENLFTINYDRK